MDKYIYAEGLSKLVKIPTVTYSGDPVFAEFRKALEEVFPLVHKNLERARPFENALLYKWKGKSDKRPIILMGHQDVVPATEPDWKYPPFSGEIAEGKVWGRGSFDCKGTLYAELKAIEELLSEGYVPENDVYVSSSDAEEVSGPGASKTAEYLKERGVKPFYVIDEGGSIASDVFMGIKRPYSIIGVYEKGYADVKFIARGAGGHSSTPPKATPIARLSAFVNDVEKHGYTKNKLDDVGERMLSSFGNDIKGALGFLLRHVKFFKPIIVRALPKVSGFGKALVSTTIVFTMSKGSDAPNVIPAEAYVIGNLRFSRHQNGAETYKILEKVAKKYGVEMKILNTRDASKITDMDGSAYKTVENAVKEYFPGAGVAPYVILGGTDSRYFEAICDNVIRYTPILIDNTQLKAMHAANENVDIDAIVKAVGFYKLLITKNI
jgi:Acetylornithine deacetylase/Succinyl-diaminopimelate desuccinylase and related deacylases